MIIRFNKTLVNEFNIKNFSTLIGSIGLYFIFLEDLIIPYPFKESRLIKKWQNARSAESTLKGEQVRCMFRKTQRFYTSAHQSVKRTT